MDSYNLARLLFTSSAEKFEAELWKEVDISICFPEDSPEAGHNCLHRIVNKGDIEFTKKLLDIGADLTKQGTAHGDTPLHLVIKEKPYYKDKRVHELTGKLGKHPMVDLLLSEQVKRDIALNPKYSSGMSHLHIACMVDHTQAIELFLKAGESVNQAVVNSVTAEPSFAGWTPLHFAVRYSSIESAKLLLYHGADIHMKDAYGKSAVHRLMKRLLNAADNINLGRRAIISPIARELKRLEVIASFIFSSRKVNEPNFVDDAGVTAFHLACTTRDSRKAREFLEGDCDINQPLNNKLAYWAGWTAAHFAACCSVETFELLVQRGADITIKSAKGETSLDLFTRRHSPAVVHSVLSTKEEFKGILLSDQSTKLLDLLQVMDDCNELKSFLQSLPDVNVVVPYDSPIWPGHGILHLAISMRERTTDPADYLQKLVKPEDYPANYSCSEVEEKSYQKRIVVCRTCECSLAAKNADGLTPVHLAFDLRKANIVAYLLNSCKTNEADCDGDLSFLHMACVIGKKNVVEKFDKDLGVPVKSGFKWDKIAVQANSTPLHIAVLFDHREIVEYLLQKQADVYAKDSLGFTPVHLSTSSQPMARLFLTGVENLREVASRDGLSHLHVAAFVDDDATIERFVKSGADVNVAFRPKTPTTTLLSDYVGRTPLHVACAMDNPRAIRALVDAGADLHAGTLSSVYDTPLRTAMRCDNAMQLFAKRLRRDKRTKEPLEACGATLLHFACAAFDLKWAKRLLEKGADPNAQITMDKDYKGLWAGFAPLHVLLAEASPVVDRLRNLAGMVRLLLRHGARVTVQESMGYSPLLMADFIARQRNEKTEDDEEAEPNDEGKASMYSIADLLLTSQKCYAENPTSCNGSSHFHYACKRNKVQIVWKFLNHGVDVNRPIGFFVRGNGGSTPLHVAFRHQSLETAKLLLDSKADVSARDKNGDTPLHVAARHNVDQVILETMWRLGADVKATNFYNLTPLDCLIRSNFMSYDELKFFLDRGCSIKMSEERSDTGVLGLILRNARPDDREAIFKLVMESCDLVRLIKNGFNAIQSLVSVIPDFENECRNWTVDMYLGGIQYFMELGCDIEQTNQYGATALHKAVRYCNAQAVEALLLLGADINAKDLGNESPLSLNVLQESQRQLVMYRISVIFAGHVWKMNFVGLEFNSMNEIFIRYTLKKYLADTGIEQRCMDELRRMARAKLGEYWTMKDFLTGPKAVVEYQMLSIAQRRRVDRVFKDHAGLRKNFPEFCGLLMMRYREAVANVKLHWPRRYAVASLLKLELPDELFKRLIEGLTKYFYNDELERLTRACESVLVEV